MRSSLTAALLLAALSAPGGVLAQVGHLPDRSPYKDLRIKQAVSIMAGYLTGGRGRAGVGPSGGSLLGVRWDITVGAPTVAFLSIARADLVRNLVNPTEPAATRFFGTARQRVFIIDGGFDLILTGRKTWHGFAPYFGASLGAALGGSVPEDSVFRFNSKFQVGPAIGVRWHPTRRFHLRFETRDILWRINYPDIFFATSAAAPDDPPLLDPVIQKSAEWTHHLVLVFSVAYALRL